MSQIIAIDIGGTQLRAARFAMDGQTALQTRRTSTQGDGQTPFERLCDLITNILPADQPVAGIAVAAPGPLDPYNGIIFSTPNIAGWENFPISAKLNERFDVPVWLGNDANLAALGEWKFGAARGHKHVLYLTISTGIGGGVIIDDRLLAGTRGLAGELGHVQIMQGGPLCGCGQRGHLEALASGTAIANFVREQLAGGEKSSLSRRAQISARDVSEAAQQGDALAIHALSRAGEHLGQAIAGFLHTFNPSIVVLGGGVTQSGDLLLAPMRRTLEASVMDKSFLKNLQIVPAALGDDAGLMGALALAHTMLED
jgi:glucokinase